MKWKRTARRDARVWYDEECNKDRSADEGVREKKSQEAMRTRPPMVYNFDEGSSLSYLTTIRLEIDRVHLDKMYRSRMEMQMTTYSNLSIV